MLPHRLAHIFALGVEFFLRLFAEFPTEGVSYSFVLKEELVWLHYEWSVFLRGSQE